MRMFEFKLIEIASKIFKTEREDVFVGTGEDDCAVVKIGDKNVVLTTDNLHEKTDFPPGMLPEEMGHMALAVNLSDLAGSGARPLYFLYTITLHDINEEFFIRILSGMRRLADKYDIAVVGGDIDFGEELFISGFAIGEAERFVTQSGAETGDKIYLTGLLGKAQLSLEQLSSMTRSEIAYPESLFTPEPRIIEGIEISRHASAMTDVSDSLAVSLNLIARKSGIGIVVYEDAIPLEHLIPFVDEKKAFELFLYAGGDYELVYTSKRGTHGFEIGEVIEGSDVWIEGRKGRKKIEFRGYSHF